MNDLWYPGAIRKPIPPGVNDPRITPVMFVVHRSASRGDSLHDWFAHGSAGIESHGYTRRSGVSEQYRDFAWEADAQSDGNSWIVAGKRLGAISWETEGTAGDIWTPQQVASLGQVLTFVHEHLGVPLAVVDSPHPQSLADGGVGWHSKYKSWNPGVHNCPGDANVATLEQLVASLARTFRDGPPVLLPGDRTHPGYVRRLKAELNERGARLPISGLYDPRTADRVRRFKLRHGILPPTAKVDLRTWHALGVK